MTERHSLDPGTARGSREPAPATARPATPFVGREGEFAKLRAAFARAASGVGGLVLIAGEPGIGKTRLCRELEAYARETGAQLCWGACHEEQGAPPYWPWIEAVRQWTAANGLDFLARLSETQAVELARLFPEFAAAGPPRVAEAGSAQFRLFDAFTALLQAMSVQGTLAAVVLEDLQWADRPTIQLLEHAARALPRLPLLVVCTYRGTELASTDPLPAALAALNRDPGFERLVLAGLSPAAVHVYLREATGAEPGPGLAQQLHDATEGNPFLLAELVRVLVEEGTMAEAESGRLRVPPGVKEALGRRFARLSPGARELLGAAALVGREFTFETLDTLRAAGILTSPRAAANPQGELVALLDECVHAAIVEELDRPGRYRFTHALMQETLLGELTATARALLHGRIGEALEAQWGELAAERPAELAWHFREASALQATHLASARRYARLAGEQAERQFAWTEAFRWYQAAAEGVEDPDPRLLRAIANVAAASADFFDPRLVSLFVAATDAYRRSGDRMGLAETVAELPAGVLSLPFAGPLLDEAVTPPETAVAHVQATLRLQLCNRYAQIGESEAGIDEMERRESELLALAASSDIRDGDALRCWAMSFRANRTRDLAKAASQAAEAAEAYLKRGRPLNACGALVWATSRAGACGSLRLARSYIDKLTAITSHFRLLGPGGAASGMKTVMDLLQATGPADAGLDSPTFRASGGPWWTLVRGHPVEAATMLLPVAPAEGRAMLMGRTAPRAAVLFEAGGPAAARADFVTWAAAWRSGVTGPANRANAFSYASRALVAMGDDELCREVYEEVRHWRNWCGYATGIGVDAGRGLLALRLGLMDEAREAFEDGLAWAEREGCPIEAGRNLSGLARISGLEGDARRAQALLAQAREIFEQLGAQLYLDDVLGQISALADGNAGAGRNGTGSALTRREAEVLRLLGAGLRNREIGSELVISERTVERHISNIYRKLDARGKADATAWAIRAGLL